MGETDVCEVPSFYKQPYYGLITPTWETEKELVGQLPKEASGEPICWYVSPDQNVVARTNMRWFHGNHLKSYPPRDPGWIPDISTIYVFGKEGETWKLLETHEELIVR